MGDEKQFSIVLKNPYLPDYNYTTKLPTGIHTHPPTHSCTHTTTQALLAVDWSVCMLVDGQYFLILVSYMCVWYVCMYVCLYDRCYRAVCEAEGEAWLQWEGS